MTQPVSTNAIDAGARTLVEGNTAFALDLYQQLRQEEGNLFFSPYSISTALAMTYGGARGKTETEMAHVLHFDLDQEKLHLAFATLEAHFAQIQEKGDIAIYVANSLWPQIGYDFFAGISRPVQPLLWSVDHTRQLCWRPARRSPADQRLGRREDA